MPTAASRGRAASVDWWGGGGGVRPGVLALSLCRGLAFKLRGAVPMFSRMNLRRRGDLVDALDLIAADVRRGPLDLEGLFGALVRWEREAARAGWTVPEGAVDLRDGATVGAVLVRLDGLRAGLTGVRLSAP